MMSCLNFSYKFIIKSNGTFKDKQPTRASKKKEFAL